MKGLELEKLIKALGLAHQPVGVKFIPIRAEYDACSQVELGKKAFVCGMVKLASTGQCFKVKQENFACDYGRQALGIGAPLHDSIMAGQSYARCGLYESFPIANQIIRAAHYLAQQAYGAVFGPLDQMEAADVVVILANAEQCMRMVQGYAYHRGMPQHLSLVGNQAVCSDLIAKVMYFHDLNLSLMCRGARQHTHCEAGEMGLGLPVDMFSDMVDGVVKTINPVERPEKKAEILSRLSDPLELGVEIDMQAAYPARLGAYQRFLTENGE